MGAVGTFAFGVGSVVIFELLFVIVGVLWNQDSLAAADPVPL